jgi:hypothetical protein
MVNQKGILATVALLTGIVLMSSTAAKAHEYNYCGFSAASAIDGYTSTYVIMIQNRKSGHCDQVVDNLKSKKASFSPFYTGDVKDFYYHRDSGADNNYFHGHNLQNDVNNAGGDNPAIILVSPTAVSVYTASGTVYKSYTP